MTDWRDSSLRIVTDPCLSASHNVRPQLQVGRQSHPQAALEAPPAACANKSLRDKLHTLPGCYVRKANIFYNFTTFKLSGDRGIDDFPPCLLPKTEKGVGSADGDAFVASSADKCVLYEFIYDVQPLADLSFRINRARLSITIEKFGAR